MNVRLSSGREIGKGNSVRGIIPFMEKLLPWVLREEGKIPFQTIYFPSGRGRE